jgi:hypothetical protein
MTLWEEFGIERNPFEVKPVELYGLIPLETFVGRQSETDRLVRNITASNRSISLIVGDRGIGKTSLANKAKSDLYQDYFVPLREIDCQSSWSSKEFVMNLLANLYFMNQEIERYKELPESYKETASEIEDELSEIFASESSNYGGSVGVAGNSVGVQKGSGSDLNNLPQQLLKSKFESAISIIKENGYEGLVVHYNNLDNINEDVDDFSGTLADLRDFLVTDYTHFIFCGDRRMENAFRANRKVNECISADIHLESMDEDQIWSIIEKRCGIFKIDGINQQMPATYEAVEFVTDLHNGNIRKVFSALETSIINMKDYEGDIHQINESMIKEVLSNVAEDKLSDDVSPKALEILQHMVCSAENLNNKQISEEFEINKTTTSNYLGQLKESNLIVQSGQEGKKTFYKPVNEATWLAITPDDTTQAPISKYSNLS